MKGKGDTDRASKHRKEKLPDPSLSKGLKSTQMKQKPAEQKRLVLPLPPNNLRSQRFPVA